MGPVDAKPSAEPGRAPLPAGASHLKRAAAVERRPRGSGRVRGTGNGSSRLRSGDASEPPTETAGPGDVDLREHESVVSV